jgi:3-oxoacyl-[acyl-carrier-protein] synthase I
MLSSRVFITLHDCLSVGGKNSDELFNNIVQGRSGIKSNTTYFEEKTLGIGKVQDNLEEMLFLYLEKILKNSDLKTFEDTLLIIGSSVGGMSSSEEFYFKKKTFKNFKPALHIIDSIRYKISKKFRFQDTLSFSTACTSSANALGYAYEVISKGIYKNALVLGYDTLCKTTVGGFNALGVLSSKRCKPFDKSRDGMNVAEGFGLLLLQRTPKKNCVEICGVGYSSDAFHMTQPNPIGAQKAMQRALTCKNLNPEDIDYINAHGTGTLANDLSEVEAIYNLFGDEVPFSSTKSITGHTLGAAGALEAIICFTALKYQTLLPNLGLDNPEIENMNYVRQVQEKNINYVLSNSFAFGGNNTSILFGRYNED